MYFRAIFILYVHREGYNGGIWQVDKAIFNKTQDVDSHPELAEIYAAVFRAFGVNWMAEVRWVDLRSPFFSALAASILFEIVGEPIPNIGDLESQGEFWKRHFNSNPGDTVEDFVTKVDALELEGMYCMHQYTESSLYNVIDPSVFMDVHRMPCTRY